MIVKFDLTDFNNKMNGLAGYADGFVNTLVEGNAEITDYVAESFIESGYAYIDAMARVRPDRLHHVYEWDGVGDSRLRLYDLKSIQLSPSKFIVTSSFLNSRMPAPNSNQIFIKKAEVMELGRSVTISPKKASVLAFEINNEFVFTPNPITIGSPGGPEVAGSFNAAMKDFKFYFQSTFMSTSIVGMRLKKISKFFIPGANPNKSAGQAAARKFLIGLKQI